MWPKHGELGEEWFKMRAERWVGSRALGSTQVSAGVLECYIGERHDLSCDLRKISMAALRKPEVLGQKYKWGKDYRNGPDKR